MGGSPSLSGIGFGSYDDSSLAFEQTELEVVANIIQGHQPMMTVLGSRHRNLQVVYNLWQNKDAKVCHLLTISSKKKSGSFPSFLSFFPGCSRNGREYERSGCSG